jgi:diguanylate cyclase (GGDEF)-like protein
MGVVLRLSGLLVALLAGLLVYTVLRHQRNIHHIALHDCLTDLPNRLLLEDRLTQAVASAQRSCKHTVLLYLDLDDFKPINDRFGHNTGDETLRQIARRLEACVRKTDTVSRISGDEFAIVLNRLGHLRDAEAIAEKILAAINQPLQLGGEQVQLGVSIGLYAIPSLEYDAEEALQRADAAMYEAKHKSKNSYRWYTQYPAQLELGVLAEQPHTA